MSYPLRIYYQLRTHDKAKNSLLDRQLQQQLTLLL